MQSIKDILGRASDSFRGGVLEMLERSSRSYQEKIKKHEGQTSAIDLFKQVGGIAKTIAQATAQSGGSVGLTLAGGDQITSEELPPVQRKIKDVIFGTEPIKAIQTRVAESELKQQREGINILGKQIATPEQVKGFETPLAMFGVGAMIALDFTGAGGEKNAIKLLVKTKEAGKVAKILKGINVAEDLIPEYSKVIAKMDKAEDVTKALGNIRKIQAGTKTATGIAPEAQKGVSGALKAEKGIMPQELQPLAQEARKYKSAVDFIKNNEIDIPLSELKVEKGAYTGKPSITKGKIDVNYDINTGKYSITEGNHRVTEAIQRGDTTIKARITPVKDGKPNFDFYNQAVKGGEIVKPTIKGIVGSKERGFITSVKAELPELKVAGQYVPRDTDRLAIKARNLVKTDLLAAEQMARVGTDDKAVATGAELLKHYSDEAIRATDEAVKDALYTKAAGLANDMAHKLTEQGRSVQAASILGRLTPEGQLKFAAREIQKYNEEIDAARGGFLGLRNKIPEITAEQSKQIVGEMKAIQEMADGTEKAMRFQKLQNTITDMVPTPLFKKMVMVWKAGLLTGLKTTGVNILSNVSHFGTEVAKDIPA
ncbi:MAG: hypothetical protein Q8N14_00385, partial [Candidatus Omnitrophota bacterium]|nr:hypothetical protein [Candidatus Omnitrophota bacterium]